MQSMVEIAIGIFYGLGTTFRTEIAKYLFAKVKESNQKSDSKEQGKSRE